MRVWRDPWLPDDQNPFISTPELGYLNNPCVWSLFYTDASTWDYEVVRDIFNSRDLRLILSIPTTSLPLRDSLYLGWEESGLYSVKSAYRMAKGMRVSVRGFEWTRVWNLKLPPKIKCFFWALNTLRLPTKDVLIIKQVDYDPMCPLCGEDYETAAHLFANCTYAKACWHVLNDDWTLEGAISIQTWIANLWSSVPIEMRVKMVTICWAIWEERNNMVWNAQCRDPMTTVLHALQFLSSWKHARRSIPTGRNEVQHVMPCIVPNDYWNLNIDVALDFGGQRMGLGWVLRDGEDIVIGAAKSTVEGLFTVLETEAMGAQEALSWIKRRGWSRVVVQSDAQAVTKAVANGEHITSCFHLTFKFFFLVIFYDFTQNVLI